MKRLTARQWATALAHITKDAKESEIPHKTKKFVQILRSSRASSLLPRIIALFGEIHDKENGVVRVSTTAARELSKEVTKELQELGHEVIIDHTIDPHVIGGVKIQMDGVIIDGTVATRLKKIYES